MIACCVVAADDRVMTSPPDSPDRIFQYNASWQLEWYEADASCRYERGIHDYFLIRLIQGVDLGYVNTPLSIVVRPGSSTPDLLMARSCSAKNSWLIYDFSSSQYLISGARFKEAESYWLSLGNESVRLVKARHPGKHLEVVDVPRRLPSQEEWLALGRMLFAPISAIVVFLSALSIQFGYRYHINRFGSDFVKMHVSIAGTVVFLTLVVIVGYIVLR